MRRPHWTDDTPEAQAFRRAELAAEVTAWNAAHPTKITRPANSRAAKMRRTRETRAKIEALRDEADRLEASLTKPRVHRPGAEIVEDVEWLLDGGEGPAAIYARVGKRHAVIQALHRAGRPDLAARLTDERKAAA